MYDHQSGRLLATEGWERDKFGVRETVNFSSKESNNNRRAFAVLSNLVCRRISIYFKSITPARLPLHLGCLRYYIYALHALYTLMFVEVALWKSRGEG